MATAIPTFADGCSSIASPAKVALTSRWRISATAQTFVRTSVTVGRSSGCRSTSRARSSWARVMSADIEIWKAGAVPRLGHPARDRPPERGELDALDRPGRRRRRARAPVRADDGGPLDVLGDDPPLGAGAVDGGEVDPALARDPPGERRRLDPTAVRSRTPRAPVGASGLRRGGLRRGRPAPGRLGLGTSGTGLPSARRSRRPPCRRAPRPRRRGSSAGRRRRRPRPPASPCRCRARTAARPSHLVALGLQPADDRS